MNRIFGLAGVICCLWVGVSWGFGDRYYELTLRGDYIKPKFDVYWEKAFGGSAQWIMWNQNDFGFGIEAGVQSWKINESIFSFYGGALQDEGDASMIPIGVSANYKIDLTEQVRLTLEGGAKYVIVNSDVERVTVQPVIYNNTRYLLGSRREVEFNDGAVGFIRANLGVEIAPNVSFVAGIGYQFDIMKGDIKVGGQTVEENELAGFVAHGGISWSWGGASPTYKPSTYTATPVQVERRRLEEQQKYEEEQRLLAAQKAEEQRRMELARRAEEMRKAEDNRAAEERRKAEEHKKAEEIRKSEDAAQAAALKAEKAAIAAKPAQDKLVAELKQLKSLRDEEILTEEEYEARRKELVEKLLKAE